MAVFNLAAERRAETRESNKVMILVASSFMTALGMLIVGLRIWVRQFVLKTFGWDDGVILVAAVSRAFLRHSEGCAPPLPWKEYG
jgi:hypothetical protein